ncbi:MAG: ferrous iron transporter B [Candidatus Magnetomorum sp.]|nr:ferrous iron transporter B [Candidatus Magnetomorum sp.]
MAIELNSQRMENIPITKIGVIGLPNSGKTQVYNYLTGTYNVVANSLLTTIEYKKTLCEIDGHACEITDTPGLHELYVQSHEEASTREYILSENPDIIIMCMDSTRLKQSLNLAIDLLELGKPLIIALNALDETNRRGIWLDSKKLLHFLRVPVIETIALNGQGIDELKEALFKTRGIKFEFQYDQTIEDGITQIMDRLPANIQNQRKIATLVLMNDSYILDYLIRVNEISQTDIEEINTCVKKTQQNFPGNINRVINTRRSQWVDDIANEVIQKQNIRPYEVEKTIARLCRKPSTGIPILLLIVYIMYLAVVNLANVLASWMDETLWVPISNVINSFISPGFFNDFLIGDYGILSLGLANAFITVLPILSVFFIIYNTLEDIGYIPNLCILTKRLFEKVGLSGASVMPLVLGFGCKTMATLTTKSLTSKRERYIAIYLIAFAIPCAAQMGLNISILGRMGFQAFAITFFVLSIAEISAGMILNLLLKREEKGDFIQELPPIRLPVPKAVLVKTYYRLIWFLEEALPVFIYAAVAMFILDKTGLLMASKIFLSPVIEGWLGLPLEMVDALILCMARHEAAAGLIIKLIQQDMLNWVQCIVAVTITTMFIPCFANIVAMAKELGVFKTIIMTICINASAFFLAGCLNWALILIF